jgi:hypothetical protein
MANPRPHYEICTRCGAETIPAFAHLVVYDHSTEYDISLCSACARAICKLAIDLTDEGSATTAFLNSLTLHRPTKNGLSR